MVIFIQEAYTSKHLIWLTFPTLSPKPTNSISPNAFVGNVLVCSWYSQVTPGMDNSLASAACMFLVWPHPHSFSSSGLQMVNKSSLPQGNERLSRTEFKSYKLIFIKTCQNENLAQLTRIQPWCTWEAEMPMCHCQMSDCPHPNFSSLWSILNTDTNLAKQKWELNMIFCVMELTEK